MRNCKRAPKNIYPPGPFLMNFHIKWNESERAPFEGKKCPNF